MRLKSTNYFPGDNDDMVGVSGLRSVELECLDVGLSTLRMAYAREWEWNGFFPKYRNGLKENEQTVTQYIVKVSCKSGVDETSKAKKDA